jgi:uncharacterized protein
MTNEERIHQTEVFLKERFDAAVWLNTHPEQKRYRLEHSYRVANIGREIARREGFDATELTVACLLHDVAYCEDFGPDGWKDHGRRSAQIARPFLCSLGLAPARIDDICYGIAIHVDDMSDFPGERTPFALSVGDADNIDRFDVLRLHEALCKDGFLALTAGEKRDYVTARQTRLRELEKLEMGTATAAAIWRERIGFYLTFYEKLAAQLRRSEAVLCG